MSNLVKWVFAFVACGPFFIAAVFAGKQIWIPTAFGALGGVVFWIQWRRYLKDLADVRIKSGRLLICSAERRLCLTSDDVVKVECVYMFKPPVFLLHYKDQEGKPKTISFRPSFERFGYFAKAENVLEAIRDELKYGFGGSAIPGKRG